MKNEKIGLLTFQNTMNYGAVLQAFALQNVCKKNGIESEIIDYYNNAVTKREKPITINDLKSVKQLIKYLLMFRAQNKKRKNIDYFCEKNLKLSSQKFFQNNFENFNNYKGIIVGSDQIWNSNLTDNDLNYFLEKFENKKYSYAASSGQNGIINKEKIECLKKFSFISVRESQLKQELQEKGISSELVLDPTLLLNKEYWSSFAAKRMISRNYVLLYQMTTSSTIFSFAKKIAKENNLTLINANPISMQLFKSRCIIGESPEEWVSLIKNADFVVTNSFHGLAFSINFNKQFFTEVKDNEANNSSRIESLLNLFELNNRNINDVAFDEYKAIDYENCNRILQDMRYKSIDFIKQIKGDFYIGQ